MASCGRLMPIWLATCLLRHLADPLRIPDGPHEVVRQDPAGIAAEGSADLSPLAATKHVRVLEDPFLR